MSGKRASNAAEALQLLQQGNGRFVANGPRLADISPRRRAELLKGQSPFAAVLCCSDSRVPPEIVFDQGLGELFVVRTAGHVLDEAVLGSLQYSVEHLHVPLIVVLGHKFCGAVTHACSQDRIDESGPLGRVLAFIEPAVKAVASLPDFRDQTRNPHAFVDLAARKHAELTAVRLRRDKVIGRAVADNVLRVVPAFYDLVSGEVAFF